MNRLNQVNMSQSTRRFGLPQVTLLTGAFATAVLLAVLFRPASKTTTLDLTSSAPITAPPTPIINGELERDIAQAKLAAAMARFTNAPAREAEHSAPTPLVEPPTSMAQAPEPQITAPSQAFAPPDPAPAPLVSQRPALPPLSDADLRRLGDKAAQAMRDGDIFGARLILERAIEAGDANALLALAETYDPRSLARMNARNVKPDPARARNLYVQALSKGVASAQARLESLEK